MAAEGFYNLSVKNINSMLERADCIQRKLMVLVRKLKRANGNETERIQAKSTRLFWEMMSLLYAVMDHSYYYLHCYFQNSGRLSLRHDAFQIKTPIKQTLKWSVDSKRDEQVSRQRNAFVDEQCRLVFGDGYEHDQRIQNSDLNWFQGNLLSLQAVIEVDKAGATVTTCSQHGEKCPQHGECRNEVLKLVRARQFYYSSDTHRFFCPTTIQCEKLESVANIADWSETTIFNLLHFFRNCTLHRSLISCCIKHAYFNFETDECKLTAEGEALDGMSSFPWVYIGRSSWIYVPEITHIRDESQWNHQSVLYPQPLTMVCQRMLNFVKRQRFNLLKIVNEQGVEPRINDSVWTLSSYQFYLLVTDRLEVFATPAL